MLQCSPLVEKHGSNSNLKYRDGEAVEVNFWIIFSLKLTLKKPLEILLKVWFSFMFFCLMKTCFYGCILQNGATRCRAKYDNGQQVRFSKTYQTPNGNIYKIVFWALKSETKLSLDISTANDGPLTNTGMYWSDLPPTLKSLHHQLKSV